ncbi:hypothetical protein ACOMHN_033623 [Nucella lapillus]
MCWEDSCLPQDLKDARIVHLYKGKGDKSSCDNYRALLFPRRSSRLRHHSHTQARFVTTSEPEVHRELPMSGRRGATYQKRPCTSAGSLRWCSVVPFYRTTY